MRIRTHARIRAGTLALSLFPSLFLRVSSGVKSEVAPKKNGHRERERERQEIFGGVPCLQEAGSDFSARNTRSREVDGFNFYFQLLHNAARSC